MFRFENCLKLSDRFKLDFQRSDKLSFCLLGISRYRAIDIDIEFLFRMNPVKTKPAAAAAAATANGFG